MKTKTISITMSKAVALLAIQGHKLDGVALVAWDDSVPGFGIRFNCDGTSMYVFKFSIKGKGKWGTLCDTRLMLLDSARKLALRVKTLIKNGIELDEAIKCVINEAFGPSKSPKAITFGRFSREFIEHYAKLYKKSWLKDHQRIELYLLPIWKDKALNEITRQDIRRLHERIGKKHPYAANRLTQQLRVMFKQAVYMGFLPDNFTNPAVGIRMFRETARDRRLTLEETERVIHALNSMQDQVLRTAILLDFHVGFRHREIIKLRWKDVNLDTMELILPDTKAGRSFRQPLTEEAAQLLRVLPNRDGKWVFPSRLDHSRHISRLDKAWERIKKDAGVEGVRVHDIRRSFASRLVELTGSLHLVGTALNQTQASVTATYARYSQDPIRQALSSYSKEIQGLTEECFAEDKEDPIVRTYRTTETAAHLRHEKGSNSMQSVCKRNRKATEMRRKEILPYS